MVSSANSKETRGGAAVVVNMKRVNRRCNTSWSACRSNWRLPCPTGEPGSELLVSLADGRELRVPIPAGAVRGSTLLVDVPPLQEEADASLTIEVTVPDGFEAGMGCK